MADFVERGDFPVEVKPLEPEVVVRPCPFAIPRQKVSEFATGDVIDGKLPPVG